MSTAKRTVLLLILFAGAVVSLAMWGNFNLTKWNTSTSTGVSTAHSSPQTFGPSAAPDGDFIVSIDAPAGLKKSLIRYLERELPAIAFGASNVVVEDGSDPPPDSSLLMIKVTGEALWTPFFGKFEDTAEVNFVNDSSAGWPDSSKGPWVLEAGELQVKGEFAAEGRGYGLVSRPYTDNYRAKLLGEFIKKIIVDAYDQIRSRASSLPAA